MASLPHSERAILDLRKLAGYCLNHEHPRGRHKARVFRQALGLDRSEAQWLREALLNALPNSEAVLLVDDIFGSRWRADLTVKRHGKSVMVRSIWIVRAGEQTPRFVTCWVL